MTAMAAQDTGTEAWDRISRQVRSNMGLGRDKFARLLQVTPRTVMRWENGEGDVKIVPQGIQRMKLLALSLNELDEAHDQAVLGDMLELGEAERHAHAAVLHAAMTCGLAAVWVTGPRMAEAALHVPGVVVFSDAEALAEQLVATIAAGDSLLVKGSRGARMERVVERLRAARRG